MNRLVLSLRRLFCVILVLSEPTTIRLGVIHETPSMAQYTTWSSALWAKRPPVTVDLRFMEQNKLLHAQSLPGNGSIAAGNAAAPSPRGIVFLSSCSCFRALSYLIRT